MRTLMETGRGKLEVGWCCYQSLSTYLGRALLEQKKKRQLSKQHTFSEDAFGCVRGWLLWAFGIWTKFPLLLCFSVSPGFFSTSFTLPHHSPFIPQIPKNLLGSSRKYHIDLNVTEPKPPWLKLDILRRAVYEAVIWHRW